MAYVADGDFEFIFHINQTMQQQQKIIIIYHVRLSHFPSFGEVLASCTCIAKSRKGGVFDHFCSNFWGFLQVKRDGYNIWSRSGMWYQAVIEDYSSVLLGGTKLMWWQKEIQLKQYMPAHHHGAKE